MPPPGPCKHDNECLRGSCLSNVCCEVHELCTACNALGGCTRCASGHFLDDAGRQCLKGCGSEPTGATRRQTRYQESRPSTPACVEQVLESTCLEGTWTDWTVIDGPATHVFTSSTCQLPCPGNVPVGGVETRSVYTHSAVPPDTACEPVHQTRECLANERGAGRFAEWAPRLEQVYNSCSRMCAPGCLPEMTRDSSCQPVCDVAACDFDGGACLLDLLNKLVNGLQTQDAAVLTQLCHLPDPRDHERAAVGAACAHLNLTRTHTGNSAIEVHLHGSDYYHGQIASSLQVRLTIQTNKRV